MKADNFPLITTVVVVLLAIALLVNWKGKMDSESASKPIAGVKAMDMSESEEKQLIAKANQGDNEAAVRLANFYDFVKLDPERAIFWLRHAAQNGHATAQYNLGVSLIARRDEASIKEAIYWLEKADNNGVPLAKAALEDLRR